MTGFSVVPDELRAAGARIQPLAGQVDAAGAGCAPSIEPAVAAHPEYLTAEALEAFGARSTEAIQGVARSYAAHADRLTAMATDYTRSDDTSAEHFRV